MAESETAYQQDKMHPETRTGRYFKLRDYLPPPKRLDSNTGGTFTWLSSLVHLCSCAFVLCSCGCLCVPVCWCVGVCLCVLVCVGGDDDMESTTYYS